MSAFFIATVTVKDAEKFQEYAQKAGESMAPFHGEIIAKGRANGALKGEEDHQAVGIVKFPDMNALEEWYHSEPYQNIIPLRDEAANMTIVKYQQPE